MNTVKLFSALCALSCVLMLWSCEHDSAIIHADKGNAHLTDRAGIGYDMLLEAADMTAHVTPRTHGGYSAEARGRGVIPSGEYAGWRFQIRITGEYSGIGPETLESGTAVVKMRGERFESTMVPPQSFCCGEGYLLLEDGEWLFTVFGQVVHATADPPHNHLFAGLATTAGTMNMNIADQDSTIVVQADPPHNPGIGLIEGFDAQRVTVTPH